MTVFTADPAPKVCTTPAEAVIIAAAALTPTTNFSKTFFIIFSLSVWREAAAARLF
ncbi:hypothetical protein [Massilia sp. TSP1-1-2]|uniref:hypothetical protein n=1 Tax=Massilia sp. TSP1-1-2 TaxID=2804649 RepID=UPI003CF42562